ncbi:uncharacterized protein LMH87_008650 [Akanthomyces muscarius]|uniref:UBC core domain-containing protein n=1 Tax=Akanthomyces muscarius TaxID=2231603 RepID=A0A9W8QJM6_AKAMU|nr:uncharacterized protein LMH87_008650 [Akanthomyces muscarius]KAJ4158110.1 hypothetical protein LMH87_008650 [Akanthomyces muscarius]
MPPLRFYEDLAKAQSSEIIRVSDIAHGDDSGALKFTYHHETLSGPVTIHMMAHDCMSYPRNSGFIVFSEFDNADNDFTRCLDAVCEKQKWINIGEAVRTISVAITAAIEKRNVDVEDDPEDSPWDDGSDFEELDPMEISSNDGDRRPRPDQYIGVVLTDDAKTLTDLRSSLRKAQNSGITVGIYPRFGSKLPEIISLSAPASSLGVANGILESWGLKESDNLVLLVKIGGLYPSLDEFTNLSSRQTVLQFRFGKCVGEKPSLVSVQSAYRNTRHFFPDDDEIESAGADEAQFPFELINMSNSIDKLLNADFMRLLGTRRNHKLSWPNAQQIVSRLELQSAGGNVFAEDINVEVLSMQVDHIPWQSLVGPISQDGALDDAKSFSLPLVAMQLALHRLANCTRYCMVCNACLNQGYSALKPYVCSNSLCLFQYLSLGLGSSIEHEIINAPYVVDMLICFLYAALANFTAREMPDGLSIKTAYVDDDWAHGSYVAAIADMEMMKLRDLDYSILKAKNPGKSYGDALREGDRILIIHREPDCDSHMDLVVKSWCRLVAFVDGEWTFERHHFSESKRNPKPLQPDSKPHELSSEPIKGMGQGNWRQVHLFGYWQNIDEFALDRRRLALLTILDGLPPVLDMRKYLLAQPGRRLSTWNRINSPELAVLNWTVASNRSLIVQDDIVADKDMQDASSSKAWNKICTSEHPQQIKQPWMQFRFLQGSPEMEQKFEYKASQMLETTKTPTIFAWHGSRLKNWHSIIRTGLDFSSVENGRACGNGVYFSHDMITSLGYSGGGLLGDQTNVIGHWAKSELQISSAIAVCELINSPDEFVCNNPHYVVDALHWIQCRYLLVSINPTTKAKELPFYEPQSNETPAYVLQDGNNPIKVGKKLVEIPIVAIPFDRRARQSKEPSQASAVATKARSPEITTPLKCNYDTDDIDLYLGFIDVDDGVVSPTMKRRGSSTPSDLSSLSQFSNKRAKAADGRVIRAQTRNPSGFDPQGLKMESLRLLAAPTWAATSKQAVRRLTMDLKDLHRRQTTLGDLSSGYYVHTDKSDNMFQWIVELFDFDAALPLAGDMTALGCASIVLEFRFGPSYPMSPPFVRVVRPQFVPFMQGGGGHVTAGGAVCLELLTNSGWNPAINIDNVIMQIRAAIGEPDRPARLQKGVYKVDYGIGEAVAAFTRLANAHGWQVPEDFQHIAML